MSQWSLVFCLSTFQMFTDLAKASEKFEIYSHGFWFFKHVASFISAVK